MSKGLVASRPVVQNSKQINLRECWWMSFLLKIIFMAERALITGITGQDGSYLAELLLEKGYEVRHMRIS